MRANARKRSVLALKTWLLVQQVPFNKNSQCGRPAADASLRSETLGSRSEKQFQRQSVGHAACRGQQTGVFCRSLY